MIDGELRLAICNEVGCTALEQRDELLAIIQEYRHIIEDMGEFELGVLRVKIDGRWTECSQRDDFLSRIDAAIAKAKGE